ncbi:hypothetical protein KR084_004679 [Drosophila pseudotakahashii]|nr:hypothetical protein KR084_004679 [Drosophila pseudotakahashii]
MTILAIHLTTAQESTTVASITTTSAAVKDFGTTVQGAENENDPYCDPSLCSPGHKHVACNATIGLHSECSLDAEVLPINEKLQKFLVRRFNELRDSVAKGGFNGLSPAGRMGTLKWDQELSHLAEFNVQDCTMKTDECRNTKTAIYAGQTVGYRAIKGKIPELEDILKDITGIWMRENTGTSMLDIMKYKEPEKGPPKYNFIQMVLENAEFVGCAILQQTHNAWLQIFFTCNYGHAPVVGASVYENGQIAGKLCKTGVNHDYVHLCSEAETYVKNGPKVVNTSTSEHKARTVRKGDFVMLRSDGIQPRDGSDAAAGAATTAAAAAEGAATTAAEGAAGPPAEGATTTPAAPGSDGATTPLAGETPAPAPGTEAPATGGPPKAGKKDPVEGVLEPTPEPLDKAALQKKFARFLMLMKQAEKHHGRRKIVVITSNHEVEDDRAKRIGGVDGSHLRTVEEAVYRRMRSRRLEMQRSGIMARSMSHSSLLTRHSRPKQSSVWAPQWVGIA